VPFTRDQFFDVFRAYNEAVWPAQPALWAAGLVVLAAALSRRAIGARAALALLAGLWLWMAVAYHLGHFWRVNPAAPVFAALFACGAALFLVAAARRSDPPRFELHRSWRTAIALAFAAYGLVVYPLLEPAFGHRFPAAPGFGLPCPTTIFTIGVLALVAPRAPRALLAVPLVWAAIGTTAAVALGVYQDYVMGLAGLWGVRLFFERGRTGGDGPRSD
jgi:hypothetical protein